MKGEIHETRGRDQTDHLQVVVGSVVGFSSV